MSTKMNRAHQQPYVKSGEDGGEYRAYGYGGHEVPKGAYQRLKPKIKVKPSKTIGKTFDEYLERAWGKKQFGKYLKKEYEVGKDEGKRLINSGMKKWGWRYEKTRAQVSYFSPFEGINLNAKGNGYDMRPQGETFYHESYHAVDYAFDGVSVNFKTSTGKTLKEMLIDTEPPMKERLEKAQKDYIKWAKTYETSGEYQELSREIKKLKSQSRPLKDKIDEIEKEAKNQEEYIKLFNESKFGEAWLFVRNYKRDETNPLLRKYRLLKDEAMELELKQFTMFEKEKYATWGNVSDMFSMQGFGTPFGVGHEKKYASNLENRAKEFFAECGSAENTNPKSLKTIKKYFPEQYKAYRECIEHIKEQSK